MDGYAHENVHDGRDREHDYGYRGYGCDGRDGRDDRDGRDGRDGRGYDDYGWYDLIIRYCENVVVSANYENDRVSRYYDHDYNHNEEYIAQMNS
ncbi:hypothetical protein INT46_004470 [Mucor plumbeus]|uniref:Uncharacterized protein n=1 Tax=Mucor plumbeus TaxID=97098 RepID=A0A8H7USH7_9FUNG|nr:hypothetical protein INT46_004470 [Mucor plumbeus]